MQKSESLDLHPNPRKSLISQAFSRFFLCILVNNTTLSMCLGRIHPLSLDSTEKYPYNLKSVSASCCLTSLRSKALKLPRCTNISLALYRFSMADKLKFCNLLTKVSLTFFSQPILLKNFTHASQVNYLLYFSTFHLSYS